MKKVSLTAALYMIVLVMIFFFGCTKDDTVAPVINLSGENPLYIQLGDTWLDPGYTATDNKDGDITANVSVSHIPNPAEVNMYSVIYSVEDKAGNSTTITRKVYVSSDNLVGVYGNKFEHHAPIIHNIPLDMTFVVKQILANYNVIHWTKNTSDKAPILTTLKEIMQEHRFETYVTQRDDDRISRGKPREYQGAAYAQLHAYGTSTVGL